MIHFKTDLTIIPMVFVSLISLWILFFFGCKSERINAYEYTIHHNHWLQSNLEVNKLSLLLVCWTEMTVSGLTKFASFCSGYPQNERYMSCNFQQYEFFESMRIEILTKLPKLFYISQKKKFLVVYFSFKYYAKNKHCLLCTRNK